jgi:hypothetical protein
MQNNWGLLNTGAGYQPLKFFGYYFFGQADDGLKIAGYLHWLQIWNEEYKSPDSYQQCRT